MSIYRIHKKCCDKRTMQEFIKSLSPEDREIWDEDVKLDFESSMNGIIDDIHNNINHLKKGISPTSRVDDFFTLFYNMEKKAKMLRQDYTNYRYRLCLCDEEFD